MAADTMQPYLNTLKRPFKPLNATTTNLIASKAIKRLNGLFRASLIDFIKEYV